MGERACHRLFLKKTPGCLLSNKLVRLRLDVDIRRSKDKWYRVDESGCGMKHESMILALQGLVAAPPSGSQMRLDLVPEVGLLLTKEDVGVRLWDSVCLHQGDGLLESLLLALSFELLLSLSQLFPLFLLVLLLLLDFDVLDRQAETDLVASFNNP